MKIQLLKDALEMTKSFGQQRMQTRVYPWKKYEDQRELSELVEKHQAVEGKNSTAGVSDGGRKGNTPFYESILPFCIKQEQKNKKMQTFKIPLLEKCVNRDIMSRKCQFGKSDLFNYFFKCLCLC